MLPNRLVARLVYAKYHGDNLIRASNFSKLNPPNITQCPNPPIFHEYNSYQQTSIPSFFLLTLSAFSFLTLVSIKATHAHFEIPEIRINLTMGCTLIQPPVDFRRKSWNMVIRLSTTNPSPRCLMNHMTISFIPNLFCSSSCYTDIFVLKGSPRLAYITSFHFHQCSSTFLLLSISSLDFPSPVELFPAHIGERTVHRLLSIKASSHQYHLVKSPSSLVVLCPSLSIVSRKKLVIY